MPEYMKWLVVLSFSLAVGHLINTTFLGPIPTPGYFVENSGEVVYPPRDEKQLYLRRKVYLTQRPRRAWLKVVAEDNIHVYINGTLADEKRSVGFPVAVVIDLTPLLQRGENLIAIETEQHMIRQPVSVAIEGLYELDGGEHRISTDDRWRYATKFQRRGAIWWFEPEYDDRQWEFAPVKKKRLRASVAAPPRAVTEASHAVWITPAELLRGVCSIRRDFELPGRPEEAWLRVTATSTYRLAVNGIPIDLQEAEAGTTLPTVPVQRSYDLSSVVRAGHNSIALVMHGHLGTPRLLADFEARGRSGWCERIGTNDDWKSAAGLTPDWVEPNSIAPDRWQTCRVEDGFMRVPPWLPRRDTVKFSLPLTVSLQRFSLFVGISLVVLCATLACMRLVAIAPFGLCESIGRRNPAGVLYLSCLPAVSAIIVAYLATYDPRFAPWDFYQPGFVYITTLSVPIQWMLLACIKLLRPGLVDYRNRNLGRVVTGALFAMLFATGFWVRIRYIDVEPLHPDEWFVYETAQSIFKRGFPSIVVHKDLPISYVSTSEIMFYVNAFCALWTDSDIVIVRFPAVCWAMLTMILIYRMGKRLGGTPVALIATAFYALSHYCIQVANFGRYYSELQFFALLTLHYYWKTLCGGGPIDRRSLWLTAISFIVMFLTWEASAIMALGMIIAALLFRRGRLRTVFCNPSVWGAMGVVLLVLLLQIAHRTIQQVERPWYGTGLSDAQLTPMWRYQTYDPLQYFWESSWNPDAFIPFCGFMIAVAYAAHHRYCRFILVNLIMTLFCLGSLLPLDLSRYAYWLVPFPLLLCAYAIFRAMVNLTSLARTPELPYAWRVYSVGIRWALLLTCVVIGSGMTLRLSEMNQFTTSGYYVEQLKFPHTSQAVDHLRANYRDGDIVMATLPHVVDHYWKDHRADYWLQTILQLQAVVDDRGTLPRHKVTGTALIPDLEALKTVFDRNDRVWFVVVPAWNPSYNLPEVSSFLLQNMDVAYEDFQTVVLFRDKNHLPAGDKLRSLRKLNEGSANFLP